jgi:hypothetical protein
MRIESLGYGVYRVHMKGTSFTVTGWANAWRVAWSKAIG